VVVHNLDILCLAILPDEADPKLVVGPDAVLAFAIAGKGFQAISGEGAKVFQSLCRMQLRELALRDPGDTPKPTRRVPLEQRFGVSAPKRPDHELRVLRRT